MAAMLPISHAEAAPGEAAWQRLVEIPATALKISELPDFAGVFRGRELTRKDRRLTSGLVPIDSLTGGIVRGRISEILGDTGSGRTSLAAAFTANAIRRGEVAAWIDAADNFDPESMAAAGVELARLLWVSCRHPHLPRRGLTNRLAHALTDGGNADAAEAAAFNHDARRASTIASLKAAEWLLAAGGFGLVVIDFGGSTRSLPQSAALRLARDAERCGAAIIALGAHRLCGTFAALSLTLRRRRACFSHGRAGAPALFEGLEIEVRVARNKLGGSGASATWQAVIEPGQKSTHGEASAPLRRIVKSPNDERRPAPNNQRGMMAFSTP